MGQAVQIFGSVLVLVSFGLAQLQRLNTRSRPYLTLNLADRRSWRRTRPPAPSGDSCCWRGAWALVSLLGLAAAARGRWRGLGRLRAG